MSIRIGINGFGRMGRLVMRAAWPRDVRAAGADAITIDGKKVGYSEQSKPGDVPWKQAGVDLVLECSGKFRTSETLSPYFERGVPTTVQEINGLLKAAADGPLAGILGYEERPLVSVDFKDDPRSAIVDAPSTMVIDETCVKILAWYDNEIGYVHRMAELAVKVGRSLR